MSDHRCDPQPGGTVSNALTDFKPWGVYVCDCTLVWVDEGDGFRIRVRPVFMEAA